MSSKLAPIHPNLPAPPVLPSFPHPRPPPSVRHPSVRPARTVATPFYLCLSSQPPSTPSYILPPAAWSRLPTSTSTPSQLGLSIPSRLPGPSVRPPAGPSAYTFATGTYRETHAVSARCRRGVSQVDERRNSKSALQQSSTDARDVEDGWMDGQPHALFWRFSGA
ncbi:uncharacterized protein J3D65DRAFT_38716 [Phyllosticta citribraziliensis]|uniref:Uncharacterized protein n=1 Tax=Phyllosticta citribraziliensis TaxID=989973 RepID=A0ABR1MAG3_9PEZI